MCIKKVITLIFSILLISNMCAASTYYKMKYSKEEKQLLKEIYNRDIKYTYFVIEKGKVIYMLHVFKNKECELVLGDKVLD